MVTEPKTPLDQALDLLVFLPVGAALSARVELPRLVEKGRKRVESEMTMARAIGQFVVNQGQKEAEKAIRAAASRLAPPTRPARPAPATDANADSSRTARPGYETRVTGNGSSAVTDRTPPANGRSAPPVGSLARPGYDTLSASQVVQRLDGLAPAELEAVRTYEAATRQRRTILTKVAQLQDSQLQDGASG